MISKILTWYLMLKKRLLKKTGFIVILFMIPVFALVLSYFSQIESGGLLRIALAVENAEDELAMEMMNKVSEDNQVFVFTICESPQEAKRQVEAARADAAWVFKDHMLEKIRLIVKGSDEPLVTVYEAEESTFLKVAREKIFGVLYPHIAYYMYEDYITNQMLMGITINKETLKEEYQVITDEDGFVEFEFLNSEQKDMDEMNYLISTLRGLLMVIMLLAGIASTMYYLKDEEKGTFSWLSTRKRIFVSWGNNLAALSLSGVFVTLAFVLAGTYTSFWRETISMILFILMASAFCSILGAVFRTVNGLCVVLPAVLVATIVFCPVFFNTHLPLQQILPPYYYLYSINDVGVLKWMILYCVVAYPLGYVLNRRKGL